jgi:predicted transcriptional regulator with HTH domain
MLLIAIVLIVMISNVTIKKTEIALGLVGKEQKNVVKLYTITKELVNIGVENHAVNTILVNNE